MIAILSVSGLLKSYDKPVLTGVELNVSEGEFVGIIGENGCGKSTLLEILAGAMMPDAGEIIVNGISALNNKSVFSENIGYVPQDNPIIEELTVRDNLSLWYSFKGRNLNKDLQNGPPSALGLNDVLKKNAGKLSGGMKKRLSIACALAGNSHILLLDEPSAALDIVCKNELHAYFKQYCKNGGAIVMATHEEAEINLCTRLYILKSGKLNEIAVGVKGEELACLMKEGGHKNG